MGELYSAGGQSEGWGTVPVQQMLNALGFDPGPATGPMNPQTKKAVEQFQARSSLPVDGSPGPNTRAKLFLAYMDFLCPDKLDKIGFLAKGADAQGKGEFRACAFAGHGLVAITGGMAVSIAERRLFRPRRRAALMITLALASYYLSLMLQ